MYSISLETIIKAPAQSIFQCITDQNHLQKWFAPQVIIAPVTGTFGAFAFEFDLSFKVRITELDDIGKISWEVVDGIEGWVGSVISFEITNQKNKSLVIFKHIGISDKDKLQKWESSWKDFLNKLSKYASGL